MKATNVLFLENEKVEKNIKETRGKSKMLIIDETTCVFIADKYIRKTPKGFISIFVVDDWQYTFTTSHLDDDGHYVSDKMVKMSGSQLIGLLRENYKVKLYDLKEKK